MPLQRCAPTPVLSWRPLAGDWAPVSGRQQQQVTRGLEPPPSIPRAPTHVDTDHEISADQSSIRNCISRLGVVVGSVFAIQAWYENLFGIGVPIIPCMPSPENVDYNVLFSKLYKNKNNILSEETCKET